MSRWRMPVVAVLGLVLAIAGAGMSARRLDAVKPPPSFHEMVYLPGKTGLKVLALGFDAPLADALYLNTLFYFTSNLRAQAVDNREAQHRYLAQCFDLVAMLSPRFHAAYYSGGLFLSAAAKPEPAMALLERGFTIFPEDWRFPVHMAVMAQQQLGDIGLARRWLERAVAIPGIPSIYLAAVEGIMAGDDAAVSPRTRVAHLITYWEEVFRDAKQPEPLRTHAETRLRHLKTIAATLEVGEAAARFLRTQGRPARAIGDLVRAGLLRQPPEVWLENDRYLLLPDGTCRSEQLAAAEVARTVRSVAGAVETYRRKHGGTLPSSMDDLVTGRALPGIPQHPFAALGFGFRYDPATGTLTETRP